MRYGVDFDHGASATVGLQDSRTRGNQYLCDSRRLSGNPGLEAVVHPTGPPPPPPAAAASATATSAATTTGASATTASGPTATSATSASATAATSGPTAGALPRAERARPAAGDGQGEDRRPALPRRQGAPGPLAGESGA